MTTADLTTSRMAGTAKPAWPNLIRLVVVLALSRLSFVGEAQEKTGHPNPNENEVRAKAEKGDSHPQFDLGSMYDEDTSLKPDSTEATKWFRKAADKGESNGQVQLGFAYFHGNGAAKDQTGPLKRFDLAARRGNTNVVEVHDLPVQFAAAYNEVRTKAERGDAQAQFDLGWMYDEGKSIEQDSTEAVNWYLKAAEQGLAQAQFTLGVMYHTGQGVVQDETQAARWYRKAADRGDSTAQLLLGSRYTDGNGVPKSTEEAAKWFRKAADQGEASAQFLLGRAYESGAGVPKDNVEALKWYRLAAAQEDADAQAEVGNAFETGLGVLRDYAEAARWYRKAAGQGQKRAQFRLGAMCSTGQGVERSNVEAVKWLNLSAAQGYVYAAQLRDVVVKAMTSEEVTEGQRRAAGFVPMTKDREGQRQAAGPVPSSIQANHVIKSPMLAGITLRAISGNESRRVALINNQIFGAGERGVIEAAGQSVKIQCLEVREGSVVISVEGLAGRQEISIGETAGGYPGIRQSPASLPHAAAAQRNARNAVEVVELTAKVAESNSNWSRWAWKLRLRNNAESLRKVDATVEFLDKDGSVIRRDHQYGLSLKGGETQTFNGYELIGSDVTGKVTKTQAKLKPGR